MTERYIISTDALIRVMRSDPDAIKYGPHMTEGLCWVYNWKRLVGSPVRILLEDDLIRNVGHIYKDEWLKEK